MLPNVGFKCFTLYNTVLFEQAKQKPPVTWDELLAVSKIFSDAGIVPVNIGSKGGNPGHLLYNVFLSQLGGQPSAEAVAKTFRVSEPVFRDAAKVVKELRERKVFPQDSVGNGDWPGSIALYNNSKAAMVFTCPWMLGQIKPEIARVSEVMSFPTLKDAKVDGRSFHVGNINNGWMVNKASFQDPRKTAAIVSLLDALQSQEVRKGLIELGLFPAWKAGDVSSFNINPLAAKVHAFTSQVPQTHAVVAALLPTPGSLTAYLESIDRVFAGENPDEVFENFQSVVTRERR